jgi:hypothetical protein
MHHLLKTAIGAAILAAAYFGSFGFQFGDADMSAEEPAGSFSSAGSARPGSPVPRGPHASGGSASVTLVAVTSASYQEVLS